MATFALEQEVREERETVKRRIPVEDGQWVIPHVGTGHTREEAWEEDGDTFTQIFSESQEHRYRIVGPEPRQRYILGATNISRSQGGNRSSQGSCSTALVGERPFGVILFTTENDVEGSGLHFVCSRQVHKGELGRRPEIPRPRFAREAPMSDAEVSFRTEKPISRRDRRRGQVGWARLAEVAALIGMASDELVRRYFRFTHAEHPVLEVRWVDRWEKINQQPAAPSDRFKPDALETLFARDLGMAWIRKGFACAALYLHHLGHVPEPWVGYMSTLSENETAPAHP